MGNELESKALQAGIALSSYWDSQSTLMETKREHFLLSQGDSSKKCLFKHIH